MSYAKVASLLSIPQAVSDVSGSASVTQVGMVYDRALTDRRKRGTLRSLGPTSA
jgi:hypothetical protein